MHLKYESTVREPLVNGHKTYAQVTEDIISPIERKPGRMWYVGFFFSLALLGFGAFSVILGRVLGPWHLGYQPDGWLGLGHYQLRMVGRYRSRRYADLGHPSALPPGLADGRKPRGGSDDHLRGNVRGPVPDLPHGPCMGWLLCIALP